VVLTLNVPGSDNPFSVKYVRISHSNFKTDPSVILPQFLTILSKSGLYFGESKSSLAVPLKVSIKRSACSAWFIAPNRSCLAFSYFLFASRVSIDTVPIVFPFISTILNSVLFEVLAIA
jgi:hypothetical protein